MAATRAAAEAGPRRDAGYFGAASALPAPVLQRDYFIHPLQLVTAKEAGAAGVVGTIGARARPQLDSSGGLGGGAVPAARPADPVRQPLARRPALPAYPAPRLD